MTRRNAELFLLLLAAPIVVLLYAMIVINQGQQLDVNTLGVPLGIFAAFAVAHLAIRKFAPGADSAILPVAFALSGIGIAFVTRLAPELAVRQLIWLYVGIAAMVLILVFVRNIDHIANYKYTLMLAGFLLLLSPMFPVIGQEIYGSRIWLAIGDFSFQPGELAKIFIVLFLAAYLAANREMLSVFTWRVGPFNLPDFRTLLPLLLMWGLSLIIVIFEKDLGSALVVFFVFISMLYVASGKKSYVVIALVLAAIGAFAMWGLFEHVQIRVNTWLDPFADAQDTGYQLSQAIYSMADGDLFGVGIGKGMCDAIPVVESDYIFAAIAEETGLLGAAGVLLLYLLFAVRGMLTAARAKSDVSSFVATGLTSSIVLQAFIIVAGVTRLIPLTGLTLPFVSQGGSSLLASFIAVGLLLRCGDEGTGVETEMSTGLSMPTSEGGVLGRVSLGKRLTNLMLMFSLLFAALVANLTMLMIVNADEYRAMPSNNHTTAKEAYKERGIISTADGVVLAQSVLAEDGTYARVYPAGTLASHVVGYSSARYGTSGIENTCNETLKGASDFSDWTDVLNYYAGVSEPGNDVQLTIDSNIQLAAQASLEGYNGACVVMNPETGAVLALASSPTYDAANFEQMIIEAQGDAGEGVGDGALLNRATQALYAPGSTFKTVSLTTALENKLAEENSVFSSPSQLEIDGGLVYNFDRQDLGNLTLEQATWYSSNTVYGQLGEQIGPQLLVSSAERFGFNNSIAFDLPLVESLMPNWEEMTKWETAWAAIGQPVGEHESPAGPQATVLQMALVGCAIANEGVIQSPYLVETVYNANGERVSVASPRTLSTACTPDTAARVMRVLEGVVNQGSGTAAALPEVQIAGKTGTAETGKPIDDTWFVGFGPTDDCKVVVAIILEQGAEGDMSAALRANNVLRTALSIEGVL